MFKLDIADIKTVRIAWYRRLVSNILYITRLDQAEKQLTESDFTVSSIFTFFIGINIFLKKKVEMRLNPKNHVDYMSLRRESFLICKWNRWQILIFLFFSKKRTSHEEWNTNRIGAYKYEFQLSNRWSMII